MGCPIGDIDCNGDNGGNVTVPDLVIIAPLQETYVQNDEIILSLSIPSENNYFGNTVDIFQETQDANPLVSFSSNQPYNFTYSKFVELNPLDESNN